MSFEVKIYKTGSEHFQTKFMDPKTGKRKRKRFQTLKEAKIHKLEVEAKLKNKGLAAFTDLRISQALKIYLEKFPNSSIRSRKNHFREFVECFGTHRVSELNTNDLLEWLNASKDKANLSERTMNGVKSQFFGFFEFLADEDYIRKNPIKKIRFKRHDNPRRPRVILSIDEVVSLLANAKTFSAKILYPYLYTIAHTGARRGEVLRLCREDVDFKTGLIHLKETKNGQQRFVRMATSLQKLLQEHLESHKCEHVIINSQNESLQHSELSKLINKFKHYFPNDKNWGCHSFRHSFAYNFLKKGGEMYQLQAILGHRGIQTTVDLYGQLQAQDIENPSPYEY
ncbi:MAG: tyrosine-type recombinase/integrase [Pseudobdellovibrionaceae bacterium]